MPDSKWGERGHQFAYLLNQLMGCRYFMFFSFIFGFRIFYLLGCWKHRKMKKGPGWNLAISSNSNCNLYASDWSRWRNWALDLFLFVFEIVNAWYLQKPKEFSEEKVSRVERNMDGPRNNIKVHMRVKWHILSILLSDLVAHINLDRLHHTVCFMNCRGARFFLFLFCLGDDKSTPKV